MAKAVAFMLVMAVMVSTFMVRADAFDVANSGRSLLRLEFFTNFAQERGLSTVEVAAAPAPSADAPTPTGIKEEKGQTWVQWFSAVSSMVGRSSSNGAAAPATSA